MSPLLRRGLARAAFHLARVLLLPLEVIDARAYMRLYLPLLRTLGLKIQGEPRYISSQARFDDFALISLGDRAVISRNVVLLTHDYSVTTALITFGEVPLTDIGVRRPIRIGRNVFVGMNVVILPGATIGDNVIIGAGSVVRGAVPDDSIVVGNPGTVVGTISAREQRWRDLSTGLFARRDGK